MRKEEIDVGVIQPQGYLEPPEPAEALRKVLLELLGQHSECRLLEPSGRRITAMVLATGWWGLLLCSSLVSSTAPQVKGYGCQDNATREGLT